MNSFNMQPLKKIVFKAREEPLKLSVVSQFVLALFLASAFQHSAISQDPFSLPRLMDQNPRFDRVEPKKGLSKKLLPLWIEALDSPNVSLQRKAAESVVIAKLRGLGPLDSIHESLIGKLSENALDSNVRIAVAKAIVALELKNSAEEFLRQVKDNDDIRLNAVLQPALAKWKHVAAGDLWSGVLKSDSSRPLQRVWAIEGLTAIGDKSMLPRFKKWVSDAAIDYRVRTAAARSLGQLLESGRVEAAAKLKDSTKVIDRVLAAEILRGAKEPGELDLSLALAKDSDSAVCTIAWQHLVRSSNARKLDPLATFGTSHREPKVRLAATELLRLWSSEEACLQLGDLLSDLHPDVRNNARKILLAFSEKEELKPTVIKAASDRLSSNWQGIQQALLILTELDHKPAAIRIVDLLDNRRAEVHITAGWALEQLSVPETLEPVFNYTEKKVVEIKSGGASEFGESEFESITHLIQLLGKNKYKVPLS